MRVIPSCLDGIALSPLAIYVFLGVLLVSPASSAAQGFSLLSPDLLRLRNEQTALSARLVELGRMKIGSTSDEIGSQYHMARTEPAVPPFVQISLMQLCEIDCLVIVPAIARSESRDRMAYAFPGALHVDIATTEDFSNSERIAEINETSFEFRTGLPVFLRFPKKEASFVRITVTKLAKIAERWTYAFSEVMILRGNRNLAIGKPVTMPLAKRIPPHWHFDYLVDGRTPLGTPIIEGSLPEFDGFYCNFKLNGGRKTGWMMVDLEEESEIDEVRMYPIHARQGASYPGYGFPKRFRVEIASEPSFTSPKLIYQTGNQDFSNPGNNAVILPAQDAVGRYVRVVGMEDAIGDPDHFGLSELQVYRDGKNLAFKRPVTASRASSKERPPMLLTDGEASYGRLIELPEWIDRWSTYADLRKRLESLDVELGDAESTTRERFTWVLAAAISSLALTIIGLSIRYRKKGIEDHRAFRLELAQNLHDEIGSNLAAIARLGELAIHENDAVQRQRDWNAVHELALDSTQSMSDTLALLSGSGISGNLHESLQNIVARMLPDVACEWESSVATPPPEILDGVRRELQLCFKESIANIAKHANATTVRILFESNETQIKLEIADNGSGTVDSTKPGMGLSNIHHRMRKIGGQAVIESKLGSGTRVQLLVPNPKGSSGKR